MMTLLLLLLPWAPVLNAEQSNKKVVFATEATYPPFVSMNANGELGGFETKLVQKLCEKAQLECSFKHLPFDSLFSSLSLNKIDAVYGSIGISERRKKQVLFTKVLYTVPTGFILNEQEPFEEKTIGVQQGTLGYEDYLKKTYPKAKLKAYASIQDALLDLKNKRIQAVFGDLPVFKLWATKQKADHYVYKELSAEEVRSFAEGIGIATRKDSEWLIDKLNKAFDEMIADGTTFEKLKQEYWE